MSAAEHRGSQGLRLFCTVAFAAGALFLLIGEGWLIKNLPLSRPFGGPDEPMHLSVARYIAEHLAWPAWDSRELLRYHNGASYATASSFNYVLEGVLIRLTGWIRVSSILLFLVLLGYAVALFRQSRLTALVALALFFPQVVFLFSYVSSEPWTVVIATLLGIAATRFIADPNRTVNLVLLFAAAGACISCRFHLWVLGLIVFLFALLPRLPRLVRAKRQALAAALLVGVVVASWWPTTSYFANDGDIVGRAASRRARAEFGGPARQTDAIGLEQFPVEFFARLTSASFYGRWGWNNVPLPTGFYLAAAIFGLPLLFVLWKIERRFVLLYVLLFAANLGLLLFYSVTYDFQPQGRYLYASFFLMAGMMLRDLSFRRLLEAMSLRRQWLLAVWLTAFLFLNGLAFVTLAREMVHLQEGLVESGLAVLRSGNVDQAKSIFESAIRQNPQDSRAYQGLGLAFIEHKNWSAAEENLQTARDLDPDNVTTRVYLGFVNAQQKSFEEAIRELEHAVQLAPDSADAHYALAAAYADGGQPAKALSHAEKAVALSPGHQPARRLLEHLRSIPENQKRP